jgi:tryptophan synthase alpha subunit
MHNKFSREALNNLERTYRLIKNNKMLIGFGISGADDIINFVPFCDGVIVGSAVINQLLSAKNSYIQETCKFITTLSAACQL